MAETRRRQRRIRLLFGILQAMEYLVAVALAASALHAGDAAPYLIGGAVAPAAWAAVAAGPLGAVQVVPAGVHRRGMTVIAIGLLILPLASGHPGDLHLTVPAVFAGIVLLRASLTRLPTPAAADSTGDTVPSPEFSRPADAPPPGTATVSSSANLARAAGRRAAQATSMLAKQTDVAVPAGARRAGRVVGRLANRRRQK
jgi:hypothetical protein